MQIVMNDNLKEALEMTCKYASEYKVDIDVHFDADGEVSVSVTPTYRDRAEQTEPFISGTQIGESKPMPKSYTTWATAEPNLSEYPTDCPWK